MGWSFRESVKILPGIRLSFSRRGVSASIGTNGLHLGVGGGRSPRITGGIGPLHYYRSLGARRESHPAIPARRSRIGWLATLTALLAVLLGWMLIPPGWINSRVRSIAPQFFSSGTPDAGTAHATTFLPADKPSDAALVPSTGRHLRKTAPSKRKGPHATEEYQRTRREE